MDVLSLLERRDKCFLGGGKGALYAPPFPKHLLAPGFWDECFFADIKIPRLFTVLVLDAQGRPFRFQSTLESWRPDRLLIRHVSEGLEIIERRSVVESQAWVSHFEILRSPGELDFFLWSLPDQREIGYGAPWQSCGDCSVKGKSIGFPWLTAWPAELEPDRSATEDERVEGLGRMLPALPVYLELGCSLPRKSFSVNLAQQHDFGPLWELSMVPELYTGKLPNEVKQHVGVDAGGLLHIVQHYRWRSGPVRFAAGAGLTETAARDSLHQALRAPVDQSTTEWTDHFRRVPQFACSDPFFTNAYWYRWYGLRLNTVDVPGLSISGTDASFGPFVTEGVGFFRNFVTYSAQAHLREVAWMESSALASGILDNLVRVQRLDGSYPGHNYSCRPARDFYHADFATGLHLVRARFPEVDATEWLRSLSAYRSYFQRDRTGQHGLFLVLDQNETGQEYMSRYQEASADAERWGSFQIGGVDATVYVHHLAELLEGNFGAICSSLRETSWNPDAEFFCDVLPDGRRSPARPATGLYPMSIPALDDLSLSMVRRWLLHDEEFWLPAGFPATAMSDPTFSGSPEWKGKRMSCPWNGRSWPMTNSHLVDGLAGLAQRTGDAELLRAASEALTRSVRLLFHDGDPCKPNSYEHYNPLTGSAALYRGYDDYMHSWVVDLILRYVAGLRPGSSERKPLPLDVAWVDCELPTG